jgi:hypothetical protein
VFCLFVCLFVCFRTHSQIWQVWVWLTTNWHSFHQPVCTHFVGSTSVIIHSSFLQMRLMLSQILVGVNSLKFTTIFTINNDETEKFFKRLFFNTFKDNANVSIFSTSLNSINKLPSSLSYKLSLYLKFTCL